MLRTIRLVGLVSLLAMVSAKAEVLVATTADGKVSVVPNLSPRDCEKVRRNLTHVDELEAQMKRNEVPCPAEKTSKEDWTKWQDEHPAATGCQTKDGGSISWGGIMLSSGDVSKAECLK